MLAEKLWQAKQPVIASTLKTWIPPPCAAQIGSKSAHPTGETYAWLKELMQRKEFAHRLRRSQLPEYGANVGAAVTATFLVLGDICTRRCGFCDVKRGIPLPLDEEEPERVAQAVKNHGVETRRHHQRRPR